MASFQMPGFPLKRLLLICVLAAVCLPAHGKGVAPNEKPASTAPARPSPVGRASLPLTIATTTGPGQSGYVHYFVIASPDGFEETQIGLELSDGRIAWSFPELGVVVSPFIRSGEIEVNGRIYAVQHQYGIRPFPDDQAMRALQRDLMRRVAFWIEDGTPYCSSPANSPRLCLSCLGFVLRVLFPGRTPAYPSVPRDFGRGGPDGHYSTDDLLLYLTGLENLPTRAARLKRVERLALPQSLRQDLVQIVEAIEAERIADSAKGAAPRNLSEKIRSGVRSYSRTPPQRKRL